MQKDIIEGQNSFLISRIKNIHSTIMTPLMLIGGSILKIENFIENNEIECIEKKFIYKQLSYIKENISTISSNINALDISSETTMPINLLIENIKILLNSEIIKNNVSLATLLPDTYFLIDLQNGFIPFIISALLLELIDVGNKKINIIVKIIESKLCIEICIKNKLSQDKENDIKSFIELYNNMKFLVSDNSYKLELHSLSHN